MAANLTVTLDEYAARYGTPPDPERVSALLSDACDMLLTAYEGRFGCYVEGAHQAFDRGYKAVACAVVSRAVSVPGRVEVTAEAPESFISVERLGGGGSMFEPVQLAVDCWAGKKERKAAQALSERVKAAVCDLDTGRSRYIVQAQLWVCE